ncbi:MAG: Nif3-like dinuclear metal center hexameric protein [Candidatus Hydrogenedentes bacterium]|nr:Nif3-like dinuclear metal center hexameric protein [Candidatus Hydrogenedentota bacterium]
MNVRDICEAIEELAPSALAYEWDRCGLAIGDPEWDVSRLLVVLTVTPEAAAAARKQRVQMIVSHHPPIWEPLKTLRFDEPHARMCLELAQAHIACCAAHTNLDVAPGGVNDALADALGLIRRTRLFVEQGAQVKLVTFVPVAHLVAVREAMCEAGAGLIGDYSYCTFETSGMGTFLPNEHANPFSGERLVLHEERECRLETIVPRSRIRDVVKALRRAHPYEEVAYDVGPLENGDRSIGLGVRGELPDATPLGEFAQRLCTALDVSHVRVVGDAARAIRNVAVIGGSGSSRIGEIPDGIDALITGDVSYHDALKAQENGLALIDAGHAATEKLILPILARYLKKRFKTLKVATWNEPEVFQMFG